MMQLILLSALLSQQTSSQVPLAAFKEQYLKARARALEAYSHLRVKERLETAGGGRRLTEIVVKNGRVKALQTSVNSPRRMGVATEQFYFRLEEDHDAWKVADYRDLSHKPDAIIPTFQLVLSNSYALTMPFATPDRLSIAELFDGIAQWVGTRTAAERIEAITVQGRKLYRMHYGPPVGALQGSKGYVDLDPERSFLATGGREEMQSWEIEYGDAADGIPVMKSYRHISRTGRHDHLVDTPTHWVTVEGAELANSIDDREFELTFYGVERPERDPRYYDPTEPVELPRPFLYALVGTGGFLVLVLSAHFLQARRRRARSAHSSSAPAGGPAVHAS